MFEECNKVDRRWPMPRRDRFDPTMNAKPGVRDDVTALFVPDGQHLLPTVSAIGPWSADALHGAAVAALFADVLDEAHETVARITIDLAAAVRPNPLRVEVEDMESGRRVQRRSAVLLDGQRTVARASALYVPPNPSQPFGSAAPVAPAEPSDAPPQPLVPLPESRAGWPGFENMAMALHAQRGTDIAFEGWFRLLTPAIAERPVTGLQRALAAADYSSAGTSVLLSLRTWSFMSLDLTVNLTRRPAGDWVGVRGGRSTLDKYGVGVAASVLHDNRGVFGRCTQTQLIQRIA
jgi:acyl-coenzyme A thioesterase PaaI-like protein